MMYGVVYIEQRDSAIFHGEHSICGVPCRIYPHKMRVSKRVFAFPGYAQTYADSMHPSREAQVIVLQQQGGEE